MKKMKSILLFAAALAVFGCNSPDHEKSNMDSTNMYNNGQDNMNGQSTQPAPPPMDTSMNNMNGDTSMMHK